MQLFYGGLLVWNDVRDSSNISDVNKRTSFLLTKFSEQTATVSTMRVCGSALLQAWLSAVDATLHSADVFTVNEVAADRLLIALVYTSNVRTEGHRPPGRPRTTWMKTIQQEDLKSNNLSLNEAIDVAQNRPLRRLMSAGGTMHS